MKINRNNLDDAVSQRIITADQATRLYDYLASLPDTGPTFNFTHVLYYLGGLIAIGAMTLFMNLGWESFGGWGIFFIALAYAGIGLKLTHLFRERQYAIPAGICATFVVALTPLAIYGLQQALGIWPDDSVYQTYHTHIKWHWLYMELGTLVIGLTMVRQYRYAFLVMPVAVTLWYLSMDVAVMLTGDYDKPEFRALISMYFGILMICLACWVDIRTRQTVDYAFWLYIFGVMAFWGGMTAQESDSELTKFIYFCINLCMIAIGVLLVRRVFVVFGALGSCLYLGHLAREVFADSWLFPIALSMIGLLIIYLGVIWQKNEATLTATVRACLPDKLRLFCNSGTT
jgi:hypothetical protein